MTFPVDFYGEAQSPPTSARAHMMKMAKDGAPKILPQKGSLVRSRIILPKTI